MILDVLVVDGHTLQAINFLHFIHEVLLQLVRPRTSRISCDSIGPS